MNQDFLLVISINIILLILPVSHDPFPLHFIGYVIWKKWLSSQFLRKSRLVFRLGISVRELFLLQDNSGFTHNDASPVTIHFSL